MNVRQAFAQLRIKITLPYVILALLVAFTAAYMVSRLLVGVLDDRFQTALLDAGKEAADTVVRIEREQLALWRQIAYMERFAEEVAQSKGDAAGLAASAYMLNARADCLDILDRDGRPLFAMHRQPGGGIVDYTYAPGSDYRNWEIVRKVLAGEVDEAGDKYADLVHTDWGWVFYTAGPIKLEGQVVGVLLIGSYLDTIVQRLDNVVLARVSVHTGGGGPPIATTFAREEQSTLALDEETYQLVLTGQEERVYRREIQIAGRGYAEVFGPFEARHGKDLGVLSVAMPLSFVTETRHPTRTYLLTLFGIATVLVLAAGAVVASTVVRRIRKLATATQRVASGDLSTQVEPEGHDEVALLADDFNRMVVQLREGRMYRDLLGLTASPEVAERLRLSLEAGRVRLEAQSVVASVLFCDIRGFTRLSESLRPEEIIRLLNEYMDGVVKVIRHHNGVVNKFIGDAALAFFGVLPDSTPGEESARDAVAAATAILDYLAEFNRKRLEQGEPPLRIGIGINTGLVVAGALGSQERFEYTVLGDTVNVAQRLSDLNKDYLDYDLFLSADACAGLDEQMKAQAVHIGPVQVKGRLAPVDVYALKRG
ncbi:MAG: HAMP domain-containing protein [Anaerolineae bacterium]|nr:HAMP domain-containing protein [Anaerolineae bacterium]